MHLQNAINCKMILYDNHKMLIISFYFIISCRNYFKKYDIVCDVTMKLSFEMKRLNYLALILPDYRIPYPNKKISFSLTRNNSD